MNKVELISIGNELLAGHTVNSNATWLAQKLGEIGTRVSWITTISDTPEEIITALNLAAQRADIIISTGGLGPTPDDLTKETIAGYFNSKLILNEEILKQVEALFARRNLPMPEVNREQAMVPESAELIKNPVGTAPALLFHHNKKLYAFLPGVPREMKALTEPHLLDHIKRSVTVPELKSIIFRTTGIAESKLYEEIKQLVEKYPKIEVSYLPKYSGVDIRLKTVQAYQQLSNLQQEIRNQLKPYIFAESEDDLEKIVGELLQKRRLTLSIAESFTGGLISDKITDVPGSSAYFMGSVITYSNQSKIDHLGVSPETLALYGAVSEQTVREMLSGIKNLYKSNCAIATTGIAGPGGGSAEKPIGYCYLAAGWEQKTIVKQYTFGQDRHINKQRGCTAALDLLRHVLLSA
jgi:nicotinamide-nucleotide amidase